MENTLFDFGKVEANSPAPTAINDAIAAVLRANDSACYKEMERHLVAPGVTGSRFFDQHSAVCILLKHDTAAKTDKRPAGMRRIKKMMDNTPSMTQAYLWSRLCMTLRKAGFNIKHGRLVGLIEKKQAGSLEDKSAEVETA